jgi:hypothetical protein
LGLVLGFEGVEEGLVMGVAFIIEDYGVGGEAVLDAVEADGCASCGCPGTDGWGARAESKWLGLLGVDFLGGAVNGGRGRRPFYESFSKTPIPLAITLGPAWME